MTRAIRIHRYGGPEEMVFEEVVDSAPAAGEIRIRHMAIGVNFTDTHARRGDYVESRVLDRPAVVGLEGMGVVEALGPGVRS